MPAASQVTILTVLDNFLAMGKERDFSRMRGRDLYELGDRVREFSASYSPVLDESKRPIYLGGWPSANFLFVDGQISMTALLYAGQLLVRDQISDWFSQEQYRNVHMMSSAFGYWQDQGGIEEHNYRTRAFLAAAVPALEKMRPLIESGIVVPVPSEKFIWKHKSQIDRIEQQLTQTLLLDVQEYSENFAPIEIAADHSQRGMFPLVPGSDKTPQLRSNLAHGIRYFSREYFFAEKMGATYTAPYQHEYHLCYNGLERLQTPGDKIVHAVLSSRISAFSGLTPSLIRSIHNDDNFAQFRQDLNQTYSNAPLNCSPSELSAYLKHQEDTHLVPLLQSAKKSARNGLLSRLGLMVSGAKFTLGAALVGAAAESSLTPTLALGTAGAMLDAYQSSRSNNGGSRKIWSALVGHQLSASEEISETSLSRIGAPENGWEIPSKPSMSITVTAGQIISHSLRTSTDGNQETPGIRRYSAYDLCLCSSGRKFKFCCYGVQTLHPFDTTRTAH